MLVQVAGHETTGSVLTWTVDLLARNPEKMKKVCFVCERGREGAAYPRYLCMRGCKHAGAVLPYACVAVAYAQNGGQSMWRNLVLPCTASLQVHEEIDRVLAGKAQPDMGERLGSLFGDATLCCSCTTVQHTCT